ncbi:SRP54 family protein [Alkalibaculum bacchi]|jgi:flagellar biosynthesis protein FlhF|uniref:Flagellar biosynthesis protein FlhF n=1 Tax=Alkalibaculum bacchi TaxID=645887 RepID=A0A366IIH9_9FIRM|nr:hypothetical protein [Alkalibaculum bacchi]RBP70088.1 SRP54 family protein [Alkalibaculum bacchi]
MIVRRYIVDDMKEAVVRAKYELGREAIIISQRNIKIGKWYNPFKKTKIEVTVAIEENTQIVPPQDTSIQEKEKKEDPPHIIPISVEDAGLSIEEFKDLITNQYQYSGFERRGELSKINVFIGPTGVGKTTTIAKIAAREHLIHKKKVGLITMDTYRIGAVEQLKTYANIIGLPFEVVNEANEMEEKVNALSYCDIILIDTLGTSPKNQDKIYEIKEYLQKVNKSITTYLILSISTDKDTILSILDKYNYLHYDALILTKFDEVNHLSNLWNIIEHCPFPIQYICNGQGVPDDIKDATIDNVFAFAKENKWI